MPTYQYNCVNPMNEKELFYLVEHMTPIPLATFAQSVDISDFQILQSELGYEPDFPIERDYHVNYYECYLPKRHKTAYILVHSAIEYVFY